MAIQSRDSVLHKIEERLHHLIPIELHIWKPGIIVAPGANVFTKLWLDQPHDIFKQLVNIHWLFVRRSARSKKRVNEPGQPVSFTDDDVGVFLQLVTVELPFQKLRRPPKATQWIFNFMRQLTNHLPTRAMLNQ